MSRLNVLTIGLLIILIGISESTSWKKHRPKRPKLTCKNVKCGHGKKCYYKKNKYGPRCCNEGDGNPITCSGITYPDESIAQCFNAQDCPCNCPEIWDPVCGRDGITYDNQCKAECEGQFTCDEGPCPGITCYIFVFYIRCVLFVFVCS